MFSLPQINCATRVGSNSAWLASGSKTTAQITIVECVTPAPLVLESFDVESSRIMAILYVPPTDMCEATLTATIKRVSMRDTLRNMGTLTNLPPHLATVWMGGECGKYAIACVCEAYIVLLHVRSIEHMLVCEACSYES